MKKITCSGRVFWLDPFDSFIVSLSDDDRIEFSYEQLPDIGDEDLADYIYWAMELSLEGYDELRSDR